MVVLVPPGTSTCAGSNTNSTGTIPVGTIWCSMLFVVCCCCWRVEIKRRRNALRVLFIKIFSTSSSHPWSKSLQFRKSPFHLLLFQSIWLVIFSSKFQKCCTVYLLVFHNCSLKVSTTFAAAAAATTTIAIAIAIAIASDNWN